MTACYHFRKHKTQDDERKLTSLADGYKPQERKREGCGMYEKTTKVRAGVDLEPEEFGRNLRALRRRLGLNDKMLAEELGISDGAIRNWESGQATPSEDHVQGIMRLAPEEVSALWLLSGKGDTPAWATQTQVKAPRQRRMRISDGGGDINVSFRDGRIVVDADPERYRVEVVEGGLRLVRLS
jgi:transcriptional regulator with XRE-family HTH domain